MSPRPLLLFVAALVLVCTGIAFGITLFTEARAEATHDRLVVEAYSLAQDAIRWSQTPRLLGGGEGSQALTALTLSHVGVTAQTDDEGEYISTAGATLRFRSLDTDRPILEGADADGLPVVRLAIYGPHAACLVPIESDLETVERPEACAPWPTREG